MPCVCDHMDQNIHVHPKQLYFLFNSLLENINIVFFFFLKLSLTINDNATARATLTYTLDNSVIC